MLQEPKPQRASPSIAEDDSPSRASSAFSTRRGSFAPLLHIDTGASRIFNTLAMRTDRRAGLISGILRISGFLLLTFVVVLGAGLDLLGSSPRALWVWAIVYLAYLMIIEAMRQQPRSHYEAQWFRAVRVAVNLALITSLLAISATARGVLWPLLLLPIVGSVIYFNTPVAPALTTGAAIIGLFAVTTLIPAGTNSVLNVGDVLAIIPILTVLTLALWCIFEGTHRHAYRLAGLARRLHESLDLGDLLDTLVEVVGPLVAAEQILAIIVDPLTKQYLAHSSSSLCLREGRTIDFVAKHCDVLRTGEAFANADMSLRSIYADTFECAPRSVLAIPIRDRHDRLLGVLSVMHEAPNRFDRRTSDLASFIADLVGSAVANSLLYRETRLREGSTSRRLAGAQDEGEILHVLLSEACTLSRADGSFLYQLDTVPTQLRLFAAEPSSSAVSANLPEGFCPALCEHLAELQVAKRIRNIAHDPWFASCVHDPALVSLLLVPLILPDHKDPWGLLGVYGARSGAFGRDDELTIASLVSQASVALSFEHWKRRGGRIKQIYDAFQRLDASQEEGTLCQGIAAAASRLFDAERIALGLVDPSTNEVVIAASVGYPQPLNRRIYPADVLEKVRTPRYSAERSYLVQQYDGLFEGEGGAALAHSPDREDEAGTLLLTPIAAESGETVGWLHTELGAELPTSLRATIEEMGVFASAASAAIEQARSRRRLLLQQSQMESFIGSISEELAKCHDMDALGEVVVQVGAKLMSAQACSLMLVRDNELELTHSTYLARASLIGRRVQISRLPGSGLTAWVAATSNSLRFSDGEHCTHPAWAGYTAHLRNLPGGVRSLLIVPIRNSNGTVVGVISLENKTGLDAWGGFDEEDERRLSLLADQVGLAIDAMDRYSAVRQAARDTLRDDLHELVTWCQGVNLKLEAMASWIDRGEFERARVKLPELRQQAHSLLGELRSILTAVTSRYFQTEDFVQALHGMKDALVRRLSPSFEQLPIDVECCDGDIALPPAVRLRYLRIANCALSNAILHSGILKDPQVRIAIRFEITDGTSWLSVCDTGCGVAGEPLGYGLMQMRRLAEQLTKLGFASTLTFESEPGEGTAVRVTTNLNHEPRADAHHAHRR